MLDWGAFLSFINGTIQWHNVCGHSDIFHAAIRLCNLQCAKAKYPNIIAYSIIDSQDTDCFHYQSGSS